ADEFAYIEHDKELYDAIIFTLSTTNGPFFATSTPGSRDTLFYGMATDDDIFGDFSRHHVSYREALKPAGPIDPEFLERIRKQYQTDPGRWTREMEAEFADDEDAYLPRELIESCVMDNIETFTREDVIDGRLSRTGKFFAGCDPALKIDHSAVAVVEKQKIMDVLKRSMQDETLHIPRDPELMNEMSNERVQLSKTGQLQFSHPAGTHDDRLWAVALAVYAARNEIPPYHPVAALGRNP